jgi:hypothetical protein
MTDSRDAMSEKRQELSPKLRGYGEGVIDGFAAAKELVSKQTNGVFTLNEPREIAEWRARLERAKAERKGR